MADPAHALLDAPAHLRVIEERLDGLDQALRGSDTRAMDEACSALQKALAGAMAAFHHANTGGRAAMTPDVVQRIMLAQSRIKAVQPVLMRSIASIERTLGALLPVDPKNDQATYLALGARSSSGSVSFKG